ncbi:MAG: hypothetical protein Q8P20_00650 [bacterium]|nr:hypothetical protein [bacterium]
MNYDKLLNIASMFEKKAQALPRKGSNQEAPDSEDGPAVEHADGDKSWYNTKSNANQIAERAKFTDDDVKVLSYVLKARQVVLGGDRRVGISLEDWQQLESIDDLLRKIRQLPGNSVGGPRGGPTCFPKREVRLENEEIGELVRAIDYMRIYLKNNDPMAGSKASYMPDDWGFELREKLMALADWPDFVDDDVDDDFDDDDLDDD